MQIAKTKFETMTNYKTLATALLAMVAPTAMMAQVTPTSQMEYLDRGLVALPTNSSGSTNFVSWRFLGTDAEGQTTFDLLRDGEVIASDLQKSNFSDTQGC